MDVGAREQGRLGLGEGPPVPAGVTPRDQGTPLSLSGARSSWGSSRGEEGRSRTLAGFAAEAAVSASGSIPLAAPGLQPGDVGVELILPIASM